MSKNVQFAESLHNKEMKFKPDQIQVAAGERTTPLEDVAPRTPGVMDEQFPTASLTEYEPKKDREMVAKLELGQGSATGYTPFGKLVAKDEDFKWYQRKQAAAEVANFERWFAKQFDLMSPVQKARAKELYPEFYAARKRLLKQQTKNLFDLARIKLEGIESFEDLKKTYLAESGRLDLGPLQNLMHPEDSGMSKTKAQKRFVRGLANPFLVYGKETYPATIDARESRAKDFAGRNLVDQTYRDGLDQGFPGFNSQNADLGDIQWYQLLHQGIAGMQ